MAGVGYDLHLGIFCFFAHGSELKHDIFDELRGEGAGEFEHLRIYVAGGSGLE